MSAVRDDQAERDMLSPREIADRVGLSYHAVLRAIKRGDLHAVELVPGRKRVDVSEYDRWRQGTRPAPVAGRRRGVRRADRAGFAAELKSIEGKS